LARLLSARFRGQVEDVLQDAFLRAWCRIDLYHGGSFAAWVFSIAKNRGIEATRRRRPKSKAELDGHATGPEKEPPAILAGMEDQKELQQRQETLQRCLEKLDERSRELIANQYGGEEDHAEVCARLGIAARYGYKIRCAAMKQLRRCVKRGSR
jgi:RNA polymerase sigma factor (sigma-70 family)